MLLAILDLVFSCWDAEINWTESLRTHTLLTSFSPLRSCMIITVEFLPGAKGEIAMKTALPASSHRDEASPVRVLVVEDNDLDAMVAQAAVEKAARGPAEVLRAKSLAQALEIVKSIDVQLVLLDLNLPDSHHLDTLERMRAATSSLIIVITVEDRPGLDNEVLERGAFEILHKGRLGADEIVRLLRLAEGHRSVQMSLTSVEHRYHDLVERLAQLSNFDSVTGLPNRILLQERLDQAITQARRRARGAGVLLVGLDRFKLVNDTLGHQAGDDLLAQVGKRLKDCVRLDDTVGRISGDEFAVAIADLSRADDAAVVAQKIVDSFVTPFDLNAQKAYVTTSIGVAMFPNDGDSALALLKCADTAMYRVKKTSRNAFCFFAADMNARAASKLQLHTDLHHAVDRREFRLHYQPKVHLASGAIIGMEALLRWQHPDRGMISPAEFIPALEDTGLIIPVGDWVIEEARAQLRNWTLEGLEPVPIAVNLSAKQFRRRDLDEVICRLLAEYGIPPQLLELEITESCLMEDPEDAVRQLRGLREAGLQISVDDFGTGYSSLAYLTRLPVSTLKIDRSFVHAAISDPSSASIVRAVIDMARNLQFNVIAEGIESDAHVAFLRQHNCEQGQGYLFGKPMPAEAIALRLAKRSS